MPAGPCEEAHAVCFMLYLCKACSSCKHIPPVNPGEDKRKPDCAAEWKPPLFLPPLRQWTWIEIGWLTCKSVMHKGNHIMQGMEIEQQKWVWIQYFIWISINLGDLLVHNIPRKAKSILNFLQTVHSHKTFGRKHSLWLFHILFLHWLH